MVKSSKLYDKNTTNRLCIKQENICNQLENKSNQNKLR
jgi:hypothetical protein